jgi:hypothetical protein
MAADIDDNHIDTWAMPVRLAPRQHESGACWILIEQWSEPTLPILGEGFMGMHLADGTTFRQAMILADLLNRQVTHLLYTGPDRYTWTSVPSVRAQASRQSLDDRASPVAQTRRRSPDRSRARAPMVIEKTVKIEWREESTPERRVGGGEEVVAEGKQIVAVVDNDPGAE